MELRITWEAVLAVIAILGFFSTVIALYVKLQFSNFADQLLEKFDRRYVLAGDCKLQAMEFDSRLARLEEERVDEQP